MEGQTLLPIEQGTISGSSHWLCPRAANIFAVEMGMGLPGLRGYDLVVAHRLLGNVSPIGLLGFHTTCS